MTAAVAELPTPFERERKPGILGATTVVIIVVAAQLLSALQVMGRDDIYVLANLRSARWSHRLFAFDLDTPGPPYMPWWTGGFLQRRFIRIPASALLWLESKVFGLHSLPFHLVTLALLAGSCVLLFIFLSKRTGSVVAVVASVLPALHPAASEVVANVSCQPVATAGFFAVASVAAWCRMRERPSFRALGLTMLLAALAVTSYEAAIVLPGFLALADPWLAPAGDSKTRRWAPRIAILGLAAAYVPCAIAIRHGLTTPDTTPARPVGEMLVAFRYDSVAYICKALGLFDPTDSADYWFHRRAGEVLAVGLGVAVIASAMWLARGSRLGVAGLLALALFLAPPLLTRVAVSALNMPTLRQLYLPLLLGLPLLVVALAGARLRLRVGIPIMAWASAVAVESEVAGGMLDIDRDRRSVAESTARILDAAPRESTVVAVGKYLCDFAPSLIWDGPSLLGIPARGDDTSLQLTAVDEHTLIARSDVGFDIRTEPKLPLREPGANRGPAWITLHATALASRGSQRIAGAMVTIDSRDGEKITALRYRFDRPLTELVFVRFRGCREPERMVVEPAH